VLVEVSIFPEHIEGEKEAFLKGGGKSAPSPGSDTAIEEARVMQRLVLVVSRDAAW